MSIVSITDMIPLMILPSNGTKKPTSKMLNYMRDTSSIRRVKGARDYPVNAKCASTNPVGATP